MPSDPADRTDTRDNLINRARGWKLAIVTVLGWITRLWGASLRFQCSPADLAQLTYHDQPIAILLWHNRLFLAGEVVRRFRTARPAYALVSASRDGALLEAFFAVAGLRTIRGSSSRLGREAALLLVDTLRAGNDIGVTPDGPRGPRYEFKAGAIVVARRARAPVLLLGGVFESAWALRSWDGFFIPKPFSRVRVVGELIPPEALADRDASVETLAGRLRAINDDSPTFVRPPVI